ncbi:PhnD/SsuA/transferrin family substrate-binding protein [uncultured Pseudoteredinibacter sp.]|uniref:PhnD/SsuA/transferrin family substrate-binding protein n=1 Tax=uncultured Pseudoteredinibacter sp. TaxID=1641701 RepID=UPI0026026334|nr:PhnD/SsuA/transferrin family substrate-binding protein [uncultured Pseudoteredinibacter sp.]
MKLKLTVSPDFPPEKLAGWHIFNTWLQRQTGLASHFDVYESYEELHSAIDAESVDLIYANAYDSANLVRDKGFIPLARPAQQADEVVIATSIESNVEKIEDLAPGINIATTADPDVRTIGMIMLEPANIDSANSQLQSFGSYPLVAKSLMKKESQAGFFLADAYDRLSKLIQSQLRPLVRSHIQLISHSFLLSPRAIAHKDTLQELLRNMAEKENGPRVLDDLDSKGWRIPDQEEVEFMIDLMSTLVSD